MTKKPLFFLLALLPFASGLLAEAVVYKVDPVHSGVDFKIRHFINRVPGTFATFTGEIHFDKAAPANSKAVATIQVNSVDTRNSNRDDHLRNEDFFNASKFPAIEFVSTKWTPAGENTFTVEGLLTMVGLEKPITLEVVFLGEVEGRGTVRSGWEGRATIDRTEWGIDYGIPAVGKEVQIELNIQAHLQESES
jgi:polyisoprenoid-binding protein YceI